MSSERFYLWSLFLPIGFPILAFPFIGGRHTEPLIPAVTPIAMFVVMMATAGAVPYVVTAVSLALWMRQRSVREMRRALLISPLLLLGSAMAFVLSINGWDTPLSRQTLSILIPGAVLILVLGYAWITLVLLIGRRLERRRPPITP